jgi:hypothetical protein
MSSQIPGLTIRRNIYGIRVDRAAAVLPATGNQTLFTLTGGRAIVTGIFGEVTTVMSATVTNIKLTSVSTAIGGAGTDLATNVAITSAAVGTLYTPTTLGSAGQIGAAVVQQNETIVPPGIIRLTTDATNTGAMKWMILYIPLDDGAIFV